MLINEKKNKGFTLVEVIVSMLVLSITITSVLLAFNLAAKANAKTKKMQTAESLLGDLIEYTEAYAKDMDTTKDMTALVVGSEVIYSSTFMCACTVETPFSDSNDVEVSKLIGITEGVHTYDVRITRDRNPAEYVGQDVSKAVTFGETGSKTVLINADVSTYDNAYLSYFWAQHSTAVDQYNAEQQALQDADPTHTYTPENKKSQDDMKGNITRELRFQLVHPDGDTEKVQLLGYVDYKLDSSVYMAPGATREISDCFFTSEEYDSLTTTNTTPQHLKQIYILYTPTTEFTTIAEANIRILDITNTVPGGTGGSLDANIFLVYQKDTVFSLSDAPGKSLSEYYTATDKIKLSFTGAGYGGVAGMKTPTRADVYSASGMEFIGTSTNVTLHPNELIATTDSARIISINIEVLDHETGQVLTKTSKPITCLQ